MTNNWFFYNIDNKKKNYITNIRKPNHGTDNKRVVALALDFVVAYYSFYNIYIL